MRTVIEPEDREVLDGMTADAEGALRAARGEGGRISRSVPAGGWDRAILLRVGSSPSPRFASPVVRLFATSALAEGIGGLPARCRRERARAPAKPAQ
jgi:sugar lactone lactonase YvrE